MGHQSPLWLLGSSLGGALLGGGLSFVGGYVAETRRRNAELVRERRERRITDLNDLHETSLNMREFMIKHSYSQFALDGADDIQLTDAQRNAFPRAKMLCARATARTLRPDLDALIATHEAISDEARGLSPGLSDDERQEIWQRGGGPLETIWKQADAFQEAVAREIERVEAS